MQGIVSPFKRGITVGRIVGKDVHSTRSSRTIIARYYPSGAPSDAPSDAPYINLTEGPRRGLDRFHDTKKRRGNLDTAARDFTRFKEGRIKHSLSAFTGARGRRLGIGSPFESGTFFWGPELCPRAKLGERLYLLRLDSFRRHKASEPSSSESQVLKEPRPKAREQKTRRLFKMKSWVQIIVTPTADTAGTSVILHFASNRYLFGNVGEGTQRVCTQGGVSISKLSKCFLTGKVNWQSTGGVIGLILTLADIAIGQAWNKHIAPKTSERPPGQETRLGLYGGKNLMHLLATTRRFVFRRGMPLSVHEYKGDQEQDEPKTHDWKPTYTDDNIKVWAMVIKSDTISRGSRKRSHDDMSDCSPILSERSILGKDISEEEQELLNDQIRRGVVSHIFSSNWQQGALRVMKLREVRMPATVFIRGSEGKIEQYQGVLPGGSEPVPDLDVLVRAPWPGSSVESLPPTTPSMEALSYVVKNHRQRGKFNALQAMRLGIKPGPDFGKLTKGINVTTKDGKTVTPEMVMGPEKQGGGFVIVELPDRSYIDNLIGRQEWSSEVVMDGIGAIIWILGKGVVEDSRLLKFRETHSKLIHVVSSPDTSSNRIQFTRAAGAAIKLNLLDPEHFPIPVSDNTVVDSDGKYVTASPGLVINLEPEVNQDESNLYPLFNATKAVEEVSEEVQRLAQTARNTVEDPIYTEKLDLAQMDLPSKDAEVITLGTGSASPSNFRNVSATLLRVPGYGSYLFDCGENTLGQMKRVFGSELPQVLRDLKLIWISHLHADHHLGTASVIREWSDETGKDQAMRSNKLMVASARGMLDWLQEYSQVEDYGYSRLHLLEMNAYDSTSKTFSQSETESYGPSSITVCGVNHCKDALAVVLEFPNTFKVAYSGDCLPSAEFARIGKGATLLIHEATFDDELADEARAKKHSTMSDALRIGRLMDAKRILLTHFSQRYPKVVHIDKKGVEGQVTIVAFDYMRTKIGDFAKREHFGPALVELYRDPEDDAGGTDGESAEVTDGGSTEVTDGGSTEVTDRGSIEVTDGGPTKLHHASTPSRPPVT